MGGDDRAKRAPIRAHESAMQSILAGMLLALLVMCVAVAGLTLCLAELGHDPGHFHAAWTVGLKICAVVCLLVLTVWMAVTALDLET